MNTGPFGLRDIHQRKSNTLIPYKTLHIAGTLKPSNAGMLGTVLIYIRARGFVYERIGPMGRGT